MNKTNKQKTSEVSTEVEQIIEKPIETLIWENCTNGQNTQFKEWKEIRKYYIDNEKLIEEIKRFVCFIQDNLNELKNLCYPEKETEVFVQVTFNKKKRLFEQTKNSLYEANIFKKRLLEFAEKFDEMSISFLSKNKNWINNIVKKNIILKAMNIHIDTLNSHQLLKFIIDEKLTNETANLFKLLSDLKNTTELLEKFIEKHEKW
jgi:hypothetical protein